MGSLEEQLEAAGNSLLQPPSSVDELFLLLDQVENRLARVEQSPSKSMQTAIAPCIKALVANELLRHPDADVKVAVASCISEITRITAPDAPYEDDQMKDVFQLIVSSFENLSDKSSRSYRKRALILDTLATVRACVVMLDLECDGLIVEMFRHFLKAIRDYHPEIVFSSMETIMTLVLEESEDISFELISPILASVKKDNQEVLPIARKLGKTVFEKCSIKLKPYLIQAKKRLGFSLDDYSKIISYICNGTTDAVGRHDGNACGEHMDQVNKESMTETCPEDHCEGGSPKSIMGNGLAEPGIGDRLAEPEPSMKPALAGEALNVASPTPSGGRRKKAGQWKKKGNFIQEVSPSTKVSNKSSEVTLATKVKPQKRSRKKVSAGGTPREKTPALAETFTSEDGMASDSEAKTLKELGRKVVRGCIVDGSSSKMEDGKRHGRGKATSQKDVTKAATKDGAKEVVSSSKTASKLAKGEGLPIAVSKRKHTGGKGRSSDAMEYGANLVGAKVKVWWPDDEKFYGGVITSFNSNRKKQHTVRYTDDEEEVLRLREEKWEFISDFMSDGEQATECQSPDPSLEMHRKKKAKTNSKLEAKQGKMEASRVGETSLSKLKGPASKSGHISNNDAPKSDGESKDDNGGKNSKDPLKKSKTSGASNTPGKSKDVDRGTPKTSAKSKPETPKTASKNVPRTSTKSKGKASKVGGTSNGNGNANGKAKSASGKGKESKGNEKSPEIVKMTEEEAKKSGKKRQRGAKS